MTRQRPLSFQQHRDLRERQRAGQTAQQIATLFNLSLEAVGDYLQREPGSGRTACAPGGGTIHEPPRFPWERDTLYIAVDPAPRQSGVALSGYDAGGYRYRALFHVGDLVEAGLADERIRSVATHVTFTRVVLLVEYPRWNVGAAQSVRVAANMWVRLIKAIFPRRVDVRRVDPNEWQSTFDFRRRASSQSTKDYSIWLATRAYGWTPVTADEADAALILEHGRVTPPAARPRRTRTTPLPR